jgi:hypothetical protein
MMMIDDNTRRANFFLISILKLEFEEDVVLLIASSSSPTNDVPVPNHSIPIKLNFLSPFVVCSIFY